MAIFFYCSLKSIKFDQLVTSIKKNTSKIEILLKKKDMSTFLDICNC